MQYSKGDSQVEDESDGVRKSSTETTVEHDTAMPGPQSEDDLEAGLQENQKEPKRTFRTGKGKRHFPNRPSIRDDPSHIRKAFSMQLSRLSYKRSQSMESISGDSAPKRRGQSFSVRSTRTVSLGSDDIASDKNEESLPHHRSEPFHSYRRISRVFTRMFASNASKTSNNSSTELPEGILNDREDFSFDPQKYNKSMRIQANELPRHFLRGVAGGALRHRLRTERTRFRLVDRDGIFAQSRGLYDVKSKGPGVCTRWLILPNDLFHAVLELNVYLLVFVVLVIYIVLMLIWAWFYWLINVPCKLGMTSYLQSLYLSTIIHTTIGFSMPPDVDIYWNGCVEPVFLLISQSFIVLLYQAITIAVIMFRISRVQPRANTIIWSDKAVVQKIHGHWYLMFRVCELRKQHTHEAHVRCYAVRSSSSDYGSYGVLDSETEKRNFQIINMRLVHPNDETGAYVLTIVPVLIVHRIDIYSPLNPNFGVPVGNIFQTGLPNPNNVLPRRRRTKSNPRGNFQWPHIQARQADADIGERDIAICQTCGESFCTVEALRAHIRYMTVEDINNERPSDAGCHSFLTSTPEYLRETFCNPRRQKTLDIDRVMFLDPEHQVSIDTDIDKELEQNLRQRKRQKSSDDVSEEDEDNTKHKELRQMKSEPPPSPSPRGKDGKKLPTAFDSKVDIREIARIRQYLNTCNIEIICLLEGKYMVAKEKCCIAHISVHKLR
eukprot:g2939.t1